jgi:hypothetical protein
MIEILVQGTAEDVDCIKQNLDKRHPNDKLINFSLIQKNLEIKIPLSFNTTCSIKLPATYLRTESFILGYCSAHALFVKQSRRFEIDTMKTFAIKNSLGTIVDYLEAEDAESAMRIYRQKVDLSPSDIVRLNYTVELLA